MLDFIKQVVMDAHTRTRMRTQTHTHTHARTHAPMHAQDMDLMAEEDGLTPKHASKGSSLTVMPLLS
jgi:electron transfer flavoprotein alpha/beta subunit